MYMAKAWAGFATSIIGALTVALGDDLFDMNDTAQVLTALVTAGTTLYAVYQTRNKPAPIL